MRTCVGIFGVKLTLLHTEIMTQPENAPFLDGISEPHTRAGGQQRAEIREGRCWLEENRTA